MSSAPPESEQSTKRRRITRACDYCHRRSVRCLQVHDRSSCQNCLDFGQPCTYNRVPKKRGAPPKARPNEAPSSHESTSPTLPIGAVSRAGDVAATSTARSAPQGLMGDLEPVATQARIMDLVELYFEIVYPIFPFFHRPSFLRRISRAEYTRNRSLFAVTMAVCSLVSGRVRDGAVANPRWNTAELSQTPPLVFYQKAREVLRLEPSHSDLDVLRAHAILSIASIQHGIVREMHYHIGQYHTLVAVDGLQDEAEWPQMGFIEREERRRLFWSIYTLDIYTSIVWGGVVRVREQQFRVSYPTEVDDDFITDASPPPPPPSQIDSSSKPSWLSGWNFTTDLYRILEHALVRLRESKSNDKQQSSPLRDMLLRERADSSITVTSVLDNVMQMYMGLPDCFRQIPKDITFNPKDDLFGFQAANITATVQLLRMVLFSVDEGSVSLNDRCQIASEVIQAFLSIPRAYQQAISAPLLHHLGGIGFILGGSALGLSENVGIEEGEWIYTRLRTVLLDLARLLARLEGVLTSAMHVSERLERQAAHIEERIVRIRKQRELQVAAAAAAAAPDQMSAPAALPQPYPQGQAYGGAPAAAGAQGYDQGPLNSAVMQEAMGGDWAEMLALPDNVFGDFSWALGSV